MKLKNSKQNQEPKKRVGVWMDHFQAFLFSVPAGGKKNAYALQESIETTEPEDHERQSEHTIHNAEQKLRMKHFRSIATHIGAFDEILLFGPGTAQEELRNQLSEDVHFRGKRVAVESAGHITQNQMVAKVREYFEANPKAA